MAPATYSTAPMSIPTSPIPANLARPFRIRARGVHLQDPAPRQRGGAADACRHRSRQAGVRGPGLAFWEKCMGRVFIAGSINMDVVATADRHPQVGETVAGDAVLYFPGGKGANQAVASAKLGASATLIGRLGQDAFGDELKAFLATEGIDLSFVRKTADAHTATAIITVAKADNTIVVIPGANALVDAADVAGVMLEKGHIAASQFEIPLATIDAFFERARTAGATTILNPAPALSFDRKLLDLVDILVLNETELGLLAGGGFRESDDDARFIDAARSLQSFPAQTICVTLGKRGALA